MAYPHPSARPPPQQSYGGPQSRDPRAGNWQQQSQGYQNGSQQDWVEDNYSGGHYDYANSYDQYAAEPYQDQNYQDDYRAQDSGRQMGPAHGQAPRPDPRYDQGYGGYGAQQDPHPRHRSKDPNRHHRPPHQNHPSHRPVNGDRGHPRARPPRGQPPNGGPLMNGYGTGPRPPRDPRGQRPPGPPQDRRQYPSDPAQGERASWDNHYPQMSGKPDQGGRDRAGYDDRPNPGNAGYQSPNNGYTEYPGRYTDREAQPQPYDPRRPPASMGQQADQRPSTASGVTSRAPPPQRLDIPPHSQTQPTTPVGDAFPLSAGPTNSALWQDPASAGGLPRGGAPSSLPLRPGTAPGRPEAVYATNGVRSASPEEMPAFDRSPTNNAPPDPLHTNGGSKSEYLPYSPQDGSQRANTFGAAGDAPRNGPGPYARPNGAQPPHPRAGPQQGRPPLMRNATDGIQYENGARAPGPRPGPPPSHNSSRNPQAYSMDSQPPQALDRQAASFNEPGSGQPRNRPGPGPGPGPAPDRRGVERPNFYPAQGGSGAARPQGPPANGQGYPPGPNNMANGRPDGARQSPAPPFDQAAGPPKKESDPDALPHHPSPVRPGLTQNGSSNDRQKPAPVRQYNGQNRNSTTTDKTGKRKSTPVTPAELSELRDAVSKNPSDKQLRLRLARKLSEASVVLASDGGRADAKMRAHNQDRYNKEGFQIVKSLADGEYTDAMFFLAECHGEGSLGVRSDPKEAFVLYQSAAKLGHPAAAYRTAVCCEIGAEEGGGTRQDTQKAVQWYKHAANLGDLPATYKIGIILLKGLLGQAKNPVDAVNCLQRAADLATEENPHAVHELGLLYESADTSVLPRDEGLALQLFTRAAKLGYKFSQFRLGQAYEYGLLGCAVDARNSIVWYSKAAAQGEHQSELALSGWYLTGSEGILEHNDTEAYLWARKAATGDPPLPKAMFAMGYFTEVGIGCPRSLEEAKKWYSKSATNKYPKAQERIEELRRGGSKVQKNREKISRANQKQNEENCTVM